MASMVTSYHTVQAKAHRRGQEERETESALVSNEKKTVRKSIASPVVVPPQLSSIRSYGIYDELMRQYAAREEGAQGAQGGQGGQGGQQSVPSVPATPRASGVATASPGPPQTSVTKRVHVMMDDMMREVFVGGPGGDDGNVAKALDLSLGGALDGYGDGDEDQAEGSFRIPALPSPTRDQRASRDVGGSRFDGKVVLELDVMSPLLHEMREIERVSRGAEKSDVGGDVDVECGAEEVRPQQVAGGDNVGRGAVKGDARHVKRVPSLVQFFQEQASGAASSSVAKAVVDVVKNQAKRVAGSKKPPLLPLHQGLAGQSSEAMSFEKFLEVFGMRETFDHAWTWVSRATQGRRKMMAVIALSYLVLLHVFLISGRLISVPAR
jgi:hypothetical protein